MSTRTEPKERDRDTGADPHRGRRSAKRWRCLPSPAMVVALGALIMSAGGTVTAAALLTSANIRDNTIRSVDVRDETIKSRDVDNGSLTGADVNNRSLTGADVQDNSLTGAGINESTLGKVPNADKLDGIDSSAFARRQAEGFHQVGAAGEPPFQNGWSNLQFGFSTAGFYKDSEGLVHLKGTIRGGIGLVFILPPGYRPSEHLFLSAAADAHGPVAANLRLLTDGRVDSQCAAGGDVCILGLDGLVFRAAEGGSANP
jgi:hypothetical protein